MYVYNSPKLYMRYYIIMLHTIFYMMYIVICLIEICIYNCLE